MNTAVLKLVFDLGDSSCSVSGRPGALAIGAIFGTLNDRKVNRTNLANSTIFENSKGRQQIQVHRSEKQCKQWRQALNSLRANQARLTSSQVRRLHPRPAAPAGFYPGKSGSPPLHTHINQQECFTVVTCRFGYKLDEVESEIGVGDPAACIPVGTSDIWNCGLAQDAGTVDDVNPLQMLVLFVAGEADMAGVPRPIWLVIKHAVVPLLRLVYKPFYEECTGPL